MQGWHQKSKNRIEPNRELNKRYDLLQAKPKLQLLQLQFIQFDYLQLQFVCITLLLFKDKYCKC